MKKIIIVPDSFKGTLSAMQVCDIISSVASEIFPGVQIITIPVADGGEGTVDCFLVACSGTKQTVTVQNPFGSYIDSFYGLLPDGTAVIEMAACAGLPLAAENPNPSITTTFGVGELILHAAENKCKNIILALGGSCTNDCGAGMAAALGVRFVDPFGKEFVPVGGTLDKVSRIDTSSMSSLLSGCRFTAMCDIDNPLYGPRGAAYIFAPQKGADAEMVKRLDNNLHSFADQLEINLQKNISKLPGAGAAGGLGAGAAAFLGARLVRGIDVVLDTVNFDTLLSGCDLVITGEGKLDSQSLGGKVVYGICTRAAAAGVPVAVIAGTLGESAEEMRKHGATYLAGTVSGKIDMETLKRTCKDNLTHAAEQLLMKIKSLSEE